MPSDRDYMAQALDLARKGEGTTSPNPMVGAVVVREGVVVGRGFHERAGGPHAEIAALREAGERARGATLYVTLEPCNHTGRTGPCTEAVLAAGVARVVAAMRDPNPLAGGGLERLAAEGVTVSSGLMEAEARRLNEAFISFVTKKRPFILLKAAATLDGRIATRTGDSKWITGPEARAHAHRVRRALDAILVGVGTVLADDPTLTARAPGLSAKNPVRVILDTRLSTPPGSALLRSASESAIWIFCGGDFPQERREALESAGAEVIPAGCDASGRVDLRRVMEILARRSVLSLLVEGGSRVHAAFLAARLADKVHFYLAPKILGGDDGKPVFAGPGPERIADCPELSDVSVHRFGPDIMIEGYFNNPLAKVREPD